MGEDTYINPGTLVLQTRIPERGVVGGLRYGAHVKRDSWGRQGYYVSLDGETWAIAWTTPAANELPEREDGETRDEAILRSIADEVLS